MSETYDESTVAVPGFTPYAQTPKWILRSGKQLSHGAVRLYGVLKSYTDNGMNVAFPGKERLAEDLGVSVRSVFTYMTELERFNALIIKPQRNKGSGSFTSNIYILAWDGPFTTVSPSEADCRPPSAGNCRPPSEADCPLPTPNLPTLSYDPDSPPPF